MISKIQCFSKSIKPIRVTFRRLSSYPPHSVVGMPALSPTMTSGIIGSWHKKVGDQIRAGDSIADIETDKASMAFEAQDDAFIAKIVAETGVEIPCGSPIMITVENIEDIDSFKDYVVASGSISPSAAVTPSEKAVNVSTAPSVITPTPASPATPTPALASVPASSPAKAKSPVVSIDPIPIVSQENANIAGVSLSPAQISFAWGTGVTKSAIFARLSKDQSSYIEKYGRSSHKAI